MYNINISKKKIKNNLLKRRNINRIHIIGCARSGTTMLHYAMCAFKNVYLSNKEAHVWNKPDKNEIFKILYDSIFLKNKIHYITKRPAGWYEKEKIQYLLDITLKYRISIIYLIRNPRDVLTSKHALKEDMYYVSPEKWLNSIQAGYLIMNALKNYNKFLIIRYEDLVKETNYVTNKLQINFNLEMKDGIDTLSRLRHNLLHSRGVDDGMLPYMHKLRDFDNNSIGKWEKDAEKKQYIHNLIKNNTRINSTIRKFCQDFGYNAT